MNDITLTGPLFTGAAEKALKELVLEVPMLIGTKALSEVQMLLDQSIVHATPYYETQVHVERRVLDVSVNDRGVVYGPWLEGTGSRNESSRFKGYASFRRATQATQMRAAEFAQIAVTRAMGRMN